MYNEKIISKRDYENNFNSYKNVKSQYNGEKKVINDISENIKSIETNIFNTKKAIENTKIYSPINGKITKLSIKKGDIVKSGQNIIEISSNEFYIIAKFSNRNIKKFKTEMPVSIKIPSLSKKIFKGHIDRISEDDNTIKIIFDKDYSKYEFQRETPAKVTVKIW
jgi:multidrug resistance efflux pump